MTLFFLYFFITEIAAAIDIDSPPNVPEKKILSINSIYFLFPANTDKGKPLAIPLPKVAKSGIMLK